MIRHTNLRDKGLGVVNLGSFEQTPLKALSGMVVYELGFGGQVTDLSYTRVVTETQIFGGTKDTTTFEGPEDEMSLIATVACFHAALMAHPDSRGMLVNKAVDFLGKLPREVGGLPLFVAIMTPFLLGEPSAAAALLLGIGFTDMERIKELATIKLADLMSAVELHLETGTPLPQVVREMRLTA